MKKIALTVNGKKVHLEVEDRKTLADALRDDLGLTGTHLGCEQGVCGACTVIAGDAAVRSCLLLACQCDGWEITTIEGITDDGDLHPVQEAFHRENALQCGFCTPGFITLAVAEFRREGLDQARLLEIATSNLCRCTGYTSIVRALQTAAEASGTSRSGNA